MYDAESSKQDSKRFNYQVHKTKHFAHLGMMINPLKKDKLEEKAKVVAAVWGTKFCKFLAALTI